MNGNSPILVSSVQALLALVSKSLAVISGLVYVVQNFLSQGKSALSKHTLFAFTKITPFGPSDFSSLAYTCYT